MNFKEAITHLQNGGKLYDKNLHTKYELSENDGTLFGYYFNDDWSVKNSRYINNLMNINTLVDYEEVRPKEWYEKEIPKNGILCFNEYGQIKRIQFTQQTEHGWIARHWFGERLAFKGGEEVIFDAKKLTPLTNDEIKSFLVTEWI
jgi:hypothetical protein